jgi:hypothetical protein
MGATDTSDEDAEGLLSVLWAAPLRAKAQLGTAAGTVPVDKRLESSRSTTADELDAPEGSTLVQAAVCSKPTPDGLNDMLAFANDIWGARCGKSARRVLLGETRLTDQAYSVRGTRESAPLRQAPHGLPSSRLVSTILLDEWFETVVKSP